MRPRKTSSLGLIAKGTLPQNVLSKVARVRTALMKSERDERVDIGYAATPVKTYMPGFTRPKDMRIFDWFPGGRLTSQAKRYASPPDAAYEPHTFFLLESRYAVKYGPGRPDALHHVDGVCREGDLPEVLRDYNNPFIRTHSDTDHAQAMKNARWPTGPQQTLKMAKWWDSDEDPIDVIRQAETPAQRPIAAADNRLADLYAPAKEPTEYSSEHYGSFRRNAVQTAGLIPRDKADIRKSLRLLVTTGGAGKAARRHCPSTHASSTGQPQHARAFHSSASRSIEHSSYNDDIPSYYAHRRARQAEAEDESPEEVAGSDPTLVRKTKESLETNYKDAEGNPLRVRKRSRSLHDGMMEHISTSIPDGGSMRRMPAKIPVEHFTFGEDGRLLGRTHASGYTVPSHKSGEAAPEGGSRPSPLPQEPSDSSRAPKEAPETEMSPREKALQAAAVAEKMLQDAGVESERKIHALDEKRSTSSYSSDHVPNTPIANEAGTKREYHVSAVRQGGSDMSPPPSPLESGLDNNARRL